MVVQHDGFSSDIPLVVQRPLFLSPPLLFFSRINRPSCVGSKVAHLGMDGAVVCVRFSTAHVGTAILQRHSQVTAEQRSQTSGCVYVKRSAS